MSRSTITAGAAASQSRKGAVRQLRWRSRYGYLHQLSVYRATLAVAIGLAMPVRLIAVEKKEPFRCGVWQVSSDVLAATQWESRRSDGTQ